MASGPLFDAHLKDNDLFGHGIHTAWMWRTCWVSQACEPPGVGRDVETSQPCSKPALTITPLLYPGDQDPWFMDL